MAKLVILTLELPEAKALLKAALLEGKPEFMPSPELKEALRKLQQQVINANPLEKRK